MLPVGEETFRGPEEDQRSLTMKTRTRRTAAGPAAVMTLAFHGAVQRWVVEGTGKGGFEFPMPRSEAP
jgi:hypothetical protein